MDITSRLGKLLPEALIPSRSNLAGSVAGAVAESVWPDIPLDKPLPIRLAMAEREVMRRVPLSIAPFELLAGRVDPKAVLPARPSEDLLKQFAPPHPGGQTAHTALDSKKLISLGVSGIEAEIREYMSQTTDPDKQVFYESCLISLEGFSDLAARLRQEALDLAESNPECSEEAKRLADVLSRVPMQPAETFYEALQVMHLLFFAAVLTVRGLYGPGRLDRVLYPFYKADIEAGRLTRDEALQMVCCEYILINYAFTLPLPVILGGIDADGNDISNDLTAVCLEADALVGLVNPSTGLGINPGTPREMIDLACKSLLSGVTKPALFNDKVIVDGLLNLGVPMEDAVEYIHSTCVEITLIGASNIMVASPYINLPKLLEFMLNDGKPMKGEVNENDFYLFTRVLPPALSEYKSFDDFLAEYKRQLSAKIEDASIMMSHARKARSERWAYPFVSCFTRDCIQRGLDYDHGGARYTWVETSNVGLANVTDSLNVIRHKVFEEGSYTLEQVRDLMLSDFEDESVRRDLTAGLPKYGNDNCETDALAGQIVETIYTEHAKYNDYLGGHFVPGFFCWIMHRILGDITSATPDGRRAGEVLADSAGAAQGRDTSGPTALIRSATSWPHEAGIGGIAVNVRLTPGMFADEASRGRLIDLVRTFATLGGFELQVNAVDTKVLRDAQANPEKHADLLVRVAGYSDYFTLLDPQMQEEVISRTQHEF